MSWFMLIFRSAERTAALSLRVEEAMFGDGDRLTPSAKVRPGRASSVEDSLAVLLGEVRDGDWGDEGGADCDADEVE